VALGKECFVDRGGLKGHKAGVIGCCLNRIGSEESNNAWLRPLGTSVQPTEHESATLPSVKTWVRFLATRVR